MGVPGALAVYPGGGATGRPMGTVKTHLHRGLARLRRALEEAES